MTIDAELLKWATPRQTEYINAINESGGYRKAARKLNINQSTISMAIAKVRKKAAASGYSPDHDMTRTVPEGFSVKGVSTYYDGDGKPRAQWVKSSKDRTEQTIEALKTIVAGVIEPIKGIIVPTSEPITTDKDLMCVYPVADAHLGMYAWKEETGNDWDADLCSDTLFETMSKLVASAPSAEIGLVANLGDFFHTDTNENRTMRSGHILDVDTRWARVFQIGVKCYRQMIQLALTKHKKVIVKSAIGNHDDHTGLSLAMLMKAYFENEPRVEVHLPINPFSYHRFGNSLLGITHGLGKADKLPLIMACDQRESWGLTRFHAWLTGHIHHKTYHEFAGCTVESFRSPSVKDNWSHSSGYRAERDMIMIKYHIERGEIGRTVEAIY